jgi:hypothetical protein
MGRHRRRAGGRLGYESGTGAVNHLLRQRALTSSLALHFSLFSDQGFTNSHSPCMAFFIPHSSEFLHVNYYISSNSVDSCFFHRLILQSNAHRAGKGYPKYEELIIDIQPSVEWYTEGDSICRDEIVIRLEDDFRIPIPREEQKKIEILTAVNKKKSLGNAGSPTEAKVRDSHFASMSVSSLGEPEGQDLDR